MPDLWIVLSITVLGWCAVIPACVVWGTLKVSRREPADPSEEDDRLRAASHGARPAGARRQVGPL